MRVRSGGPDPLFFGRLVRAGGAGLHLFAVTNEDGGGTWLGSVSPFGMFACHFGRKHRYMGCLRVTSAANIVT